MRDEFEPSEYMPCSKCGKDTAISRGQYDPRQEQHYGYRMCDKCREEINNMWRRIPEEDREKLLRELFL